MDRLSDEASPATHDLCALHADRFTPPQGWSCTDNRIVAPLFGDAEVQLADADVQGDRPTGRADRVAS